VAGTPDHGRHGVGCGLLFAVKLFFDSYHALLVWWLLTCVIAVVAEVLFQTRWRPRFCER